MTWGSFKHLDIDKREEDHLSLEPHEVKKPALVFKHTSSSDSHISMKTNMANAQFMLWGHSVGMDCVLICML